MGVYEEVLDNHRKWKQGFHKPMRLGVTKKVRNVVCLTRGTYAQHRRAARVSFANKSLRRAIAAACWPAPVPLLDAVLVCQCHQLKIVRALTCLRVGLNNCYRLQLTVLTCMDSRLKPEEFLGLDIGDAVRPPASMPLARALHFKGCMASIPGGTRLSLATAPWFLSVAGVNIIVGCSQRARCTRQ